jgi:preprotein translocase subunit SecA
MVQRGHNFAVVDEVDSILIDEARTPLIISGPADGASNWYLEFARIAPLMEKDVHYEVDLAKRTIGVLEIGVEFVEDQLGIDNLYEAANSPLVSYLNNAIKAKELFLRDKDYIVRDGEVLIVDAFTGRVLIDATTRDSTSHEAKERRDRPRTRRRHHHAATFPPLRQPRADGTAQTEAAEL